MDSTFHGSLRSAQRDQVRGWHACQGTCHHCWITLPDATIRFRVSDMILNVHSGASYLSEKDAYSRACVHFFMGWHPKDGDPIKLDGAFFTLCTILWFVVALAAEAKLSALFLNCKEGIIFWLTLEELGHSQPWTPVHCDNATTVGITNNTIKQQRSRSMEMRYFWVGDKEAQDVYKIKWHPGQENLADYQSKHHIGSHHIGVCHWYLHELILPWYYQEQTDQALWKGVLGTSLRAKYKTYPYREFHGTRALSSQECHLYTRYLYTARKCIEFPHTIVPVE
jgi:hypothetical protein